MSKTVSSLPSDPLELDTAVRIDGAAEYGIYSESQEVVAMILLGEDQAHGLGYDKDVEGWVRFDSISIENTDDGPDILEATVKEWLTWLC